MPLTPPIASYEISCRLDTEKKTVEGTEVLTWKNTTSRPASTLRLHLYLNAFRPSINTTGTSSLNFFRNSSASALAASRFQALANKLSAAQRARYW